MSVFFPLFAFRFFFSVVNVMALLEKYLDITVFIVQFSTFHRDRNYTHRKCVGVLDVL